MKKVCVLLLALSLMFTFIIVAGVAEQEWHWSNDNAIEFRVVHFLEEKYPKFRLGIQLRVDDIEVSDTRYMHYDLSEFINEYISLNPSYKNRKIPVSVSSKSPVISRVDDINYLGKVQIIIGYTTKGTPLTKTLDVQLDLGVFFPSIFVNYNIIHASNVLSNYKNKQINIKSIEVTEATLYKSLSNENSIVLIFNVLEEDNAGHKSKNDLYSRMNIITNEVETYNLTKIMNYVNANAVSWAKNNSDSSEIYVITAQIEAVTAIINDGDKSTATQLSVKQIMDSLQ